MRNYKSKDIVSLKASQYGVDNDANDYVRTCTVGSDGKAYKVPGDLMGTPKNAFEGVKTNTGWKQIEKTDFIVEHDNNISIIPEAVFKLLFTES